MKKDKNTTKLRTIDQFEFQIAPISIVFDKKQLNSFYIYVQKGAQVLGKIDQLIDGSKTQHQFSSNHNKKFRIATDKNLIYQWSIYRISDDEQEEYLESISFNIKSRYQQYTEEIYKIQVDLYRIYLQKQKKTELQQIWKDLRYDLTKNQFQMSCAFPKLNAKIIFKIKIKCDFDVMYEQWQQIRQRKKAQKLTLTNRKASLDSKNKTSESSSVIDIRQKSQQGIQTFQLIKGQTAARQAYLKMDKQSEQQAQNLRQSQIRVTNPQGVDVTAQIPQKFLNHKRTMDDDYYYKKKTSMLSDIIQQSYEGSSNVNLTKSNQGERLKSVDQLREEDEPLFSPQIKTQTFESEKHQEYLNGIKRTITLVQVPSQQFDIQQTPKTSTKKTSVYFPSYQNKKQLEKQKANIFVSQTLRKTSLTSSQLEQQKKQIVNDLTEARKHTIKNVIKIVVIVVLMMFVLNFFNLFTDQQNQVKKKTTKKQLYADYSHQNKPKIPKNKLQKTKAH